MQNIHIFPDNLKFKQCVQSSSAAQNWPTEEVATAKQLGNKKMFSHWSFVHRLGAINERHGFTDPDPPQNVMDPEHCQEHEMFTVFTLY